MKATIILTAAVLLAACNNPSTTSTTTSDTAKAAPAATAPEEKEWVPVDSATAMKAWMDYATPGDAHKAMAKGAGNWEGETTMWMTPGAPPMTSKSSSSSKMAMGGRYEISSFSGNFMGQPFEGMSIMGYDNSKKAFVSTWIDNMGTGIMHMEGTADASGKTITMSGKMTDPSNGRECDMKEILTFVDDDHHTMEMYGPDPATGKQFKNMEIKFTRKK
jgi:hypothetical protein